jgi:hypothetical protein
MPSTSSAGAPPAPRRVELPLGGEADCYTRDNLTRIFACDHAELGRLLRDKVAPLPVRIDGNVLWYADEVSDAVRDVQTVLDRNRRRRAAR